MECWINYNAARAVTNEILGLIIKTINIFPCMNTHMARKIDTKKDFKCRFVLWNFTLEMLGAKVHYHTSYTPIPWVSEYLPQVEVSNLSIADWMY